MALRDGTVDTPDGLRVHYTVEGPEDGTQHAPPLLCAAGGPGRAAEYLGALGGLTTSRAVVRVDTRGTGRSTAPQDPSGYAVERLADDLEAVRRDLGSDRVDVLGHSAGGPVALAYAARSPEAVRRLVLVTTYLDGGPDLDAERERIRGTRAGESWYPEALDALEGMPYARAAERQRLSRLQRPFYYGVWDGRTQAHAAAADHQMTPRAETAISAALQEARGRAGDLVAAVTRAGVPVLVVAGALDVITPPSGCRRLADSLPQARFVELDGVGHFPWVDGPEPFAGAVGAFLDEQ